MLAEFIAEKLRSVFGRLFQSPAPSPPTQNSPPAQDPRNLPHLRPYYSERDLQARLRAEIESLEPGLRIIDGGKERTGKSARIDITAQDRNGTKVAIELKFGRAAVGQLISYMGDLTAAHGAAVGGILVAEDFDDGARSAARTAGAQLLPGIQIHHRLSVERLRIEVVRELLGDRLHRVRVGGEHRYLVGRVERLLAVVP